MKIPRIHLAIPAAAILVVMSWLSVEAGDGAVGAPSEITPPLVAAVDRALEYLAKHQEEDGSWLGNVGYKLNADYAIEKEQVGHVGTTALACMAFLAGGNVPGRGRYGDVIEKGLDWILAQVNEQGYITAGGTRMYDHAFATLFLAEIYGMTHRADIRAPLQKAVTLIVKSQNKEGGWRYEPFSPESDMSVTVCQVMGLRAARNIGIHVDRGAIDRAVNYVKRSAVHDVPARFRFQGFGGYEGDERGSFRYQAQDNSRSSFPLTAAGIATLHGAGIYSDENIRYGVDYLRREHDRFSYRYGDTEGGHYFFYYGHYYAVQAMYIVGGEDWKIYFEKIREQLLRMQETDGSWPNRIGPGRNFGTAVGALILEIPYRYLPIFQR